MTVLLVDPFSFEEKVPTIPLSLLSLYPVLKNAGIDVKILNNFNHKDLIRVLNKHDIDLLGITTNTGTGLISALKISKMAKKIGIPVFWGGPHATILPYQTLQNPYVDGVVIGEGEKTIIDLVKNINSLENVKGIMFKKFKKIIRCPSQQLIKNLDSIPFPAWNLIKRFPRSPLLYNQAYCCIESSRGCPFNCSFCFCQFGKKWRYKSVKRIMEEINYIESMGISSISFVDDNFLLSKRRVVKLCKNIIRDKKNIQWAVRGARVDQVDKELIQWMKKAGCVYISLGAESGSEKILNIMNKNISIQQTKKAFNLCHEADILAGAFIMTNLPGETKEDLNKTIKLIHDIQPALITFFYYTPYPGTKLYKMALKHGFKEPRTTEEWEKIDINPLSQNFSEIDMFTLKNAKKWIDYRYSSKTLFEEWKNKKGIVEALKLAFMTKYYKFFREAYQNK